ncbi:DUF4391 domain-containing protein [Candidatus Thioglobus autotrophicus]|uniref:DUF4391 domain-containing protein n=1 Tax=Candidatus Thioglobus autotrophicus TaxID=1705394 RepID=UPI00299DE2CC|nr:DUF4391 domain-containing protein [Candidatus Thioglobus autotrophicus]WPE18714.1 DUF4391 domain-containing protein [Candidatus Thioglobus autotrophicus]
MLFDYPTKARFGRKIPKSKLYENASVNTKLKDKFVNQIENIVWQYKLAPDTLNLDATDKVPEIQVFDIFLKTKEIDQALLEVIDKAINYPIIFQIHKGNKVKIKAAYKRPSESANNKWVIESYFESEWLDKDMAKQSMPQALDLGKLYEQLLKSLMPVEVSSSKTTQTLDEQVGIINQINSLQKELDKLNSKYKKEKQRNRQFEINKQIKLKQKELNQLTKA